MKILMDSAAMERAITRIAYEIIERNKGVENLALIGIQRRGVVLANRIARIIMQTEGKKIDQGVLDITLYRDDLSMLAEHPIINGTEIGFPIEKKTVILVDDVLYTGRTIRAAIEAVFDYGRPDVIQLAVLTDRGHRELPIRADYVGKNIPTAKYEEVRVNVSEIDGVNSVEIEGDKA